VKVLHDKETLVSPPDAVAEGFVRLLAANRPGPALDKLSDDTRTRTREKDLRSFIARIRARAGGIDEVRSERGSIKPDTATAIVYVKGSRDRELRLTFRLKQKQGEWRISQLTPL
jgi:hypothetical protein